MEISKKLAVSEKLLNAMGPERSAFPSQAAYLTELAV